MKTLMLASSLILFSMASQATSFSDRTAQDAIREHQRVVADYAQKQGKSVPEIEDYRYGMNLDMYRFVRLSQDPRNCTVYPRLMTFEDTQGTLRTVRYSMFSRCLNDT
ncbi:DUF2790 domain-containing protein [Pseudomonas cremoricolorata]|uniref:DUF2790 domain-containing protein n=1 Tax=Pseudomonas cremoricolorata TaxID=157783 RepID=A0A089WQX0_9PSED|nr:DUF2790 domain-containing protein [Pseudomonas cremoricolorata]AIR88892.1 hypothetical protein LK03_06260 [Pseudomonas cremoricolorata]